MSFFFLVLFFSRILFKDKDRNWDEIENKLRSESDIPLLKTSNKVQKCLSHSIVILKKIAVLLGANSYFPSSLQEISSILLELKRVEKQLQGKKKQSLEAETHLTSSTFAWFYLFICILC